MNASQPNIRVEQCTGPLAFFADIHGNLPALDAVIAACHEAGVSAFFAAGDLVFRSGHEARPLEVWLRLVEIGAHCTRGVSDLALAALDPNKLQPRDLIERQAAERFLWTRTELGELILARLRRLPDILRIELDNGEEIAVVHGSPADPMESITHDLSDDEVSALLGMDPADIVVCGGSHVPFQREVGHVRVVGVGSVGDAAGERIAHYTLIHPERGELMINRCWVPY